MTDVIKMLLGFVVVLVLLKLVTGCASTGPGPDPNDPTAPPPAVSLPKDPLAPPGTPFYRHADAGADAQ